MNLWACGQLSTSPETRTWYRAIQPQFWTTALQTSQTTTFPTRFNEGANAHPQFEILYLAEDHQLALFEAQALLGSPLTPGSIGQHHDSIYRKRVPRPHIAKSRWRSMRLVNSRKRRSARLRGKK